MSQVEPDAFGLLARAVAGRPVSVVASGEERSFSDGESIFLADLPEPWLQTSLIAQAALLANGSLDGRVMVRITGRRSLRLRYLTLEAARAAAVMGDVLPRGVSTRLAGLYDGEVPASPQESLAVALDARRPVPEAPEWLGTVKPIRVLRTNPAGLGGTPSEADRDGSSVEQTLRELDDEEESERSRILELLSAPLRNPLSSMMQKLLGMGRSPGEGGGEELPVGGSSVGPVGTNAKSARARVRASPVPAAEPVGYRYPEWDVRRGRYRDDYCSVAEFDPPADLDRRGASIDTGDPLLRRELARLGLSLQRHRRQHEGDVLDLEALVDLWIDRAAGHTGDERVYETKRRTAHDLGVLVLLDATGSTGESSEGARVFDEQRLLAAKLTMALEELGDRVATYGFYSRGREAVRFLRVKGFDDRYDHAAQRRLESLDAGGYTRLGAAIRHATFLLSRRAGTAQLLLVVVGDGLPYEDGYEHRHAQEDSRRALQEAIGRGVACACVSVRSGTDAEILQRVWGEVSHRRLDDAAALARHVRPLFADALRAAAATRRVTQGPRAAVPAGAA